MDNVGFTRGSKRFSYRVAGLCVHDGFALLHRAEPDDFWSLPGGRCQIGEPSNLAVERELLEEMGVTVQATRLLWFVENFFGNAVEQVHEIACFYLFDLPEGSPLLAKERDHPGIESGMEGENLRLIFRWVPISRLATTRLYPSFLRTKIADLPMVPTHLVHYDPDESSGS